MSEGRGATYNENEKHTCSPLIGVLEREGKTVVNSNNGDLGELLFLLR